MHASVDAHFQAQFCAQPHTIGQKQEQLNVSGLSESRAAAARCKWPGDLLTHCLVSQELGVRNHSLEASFVPDETLVAGPGCMSVYPLRSAGSTTTWSKEKGCPAYSNCSPEQTVLCSRLSGLLQQALTLALKSNNRSVVITDQCPPLTTSQAFSGQVTVTRVVTTFCHKPKGLKTWPVLSFDNGFGLLSSTPSCICALMSSKPIIDQEMPKIQ